MDKAQIAQEIFLGPMNEAAGIVRRYQQGHGFRTYIKERMTLLVPIGLLMVLTSVACAAGTVLFLGGTTSLLVLLAMLLVPVVLGGSFLVQVFVFASWLESRALARALHRSPQPGGPITMHLRRAGMDMGTMPPVPWVLVVLFVALPFLMLFQVVPLYATLLLLLHIGAPFAFARFDRQ